SGQPSMAGLTWRNGVSPDPLPAVAAGADRVRPRWSLPRARLVTARQVSVTHPLDPLLVFLPAIDDALDEPLRIAKVLDDPQPVRLVEAVLPERRDWGRRAPLARDELGEVRGNVPRPEPPLEQSLGLPGGRPRQALHLLRSGERDGPGPAVGRAHPVRQLRLPHPLVRRPPGSGRFLLVLHRTDLLV